MIRFGRLNLALVMLLLLPVTAAAQKDTKITKEAEKFLGLAMAKQNPAERTQLYQTAMTHLRQGMQSEPTNAKVWYLSGTVLAALGEMQEADQAFKKAIEIHPPYAADIESEREAAWIEAFNAGLAKMDEKDFPGAIRLMENAQLIYTLRPEALMNLGALYANTNELNKAEKAFQDAIVATQSPLFEKLDAEGKASWLRFRDMANLNIAQMAGARGVEAFGAKEFEKAAAEFKKATELNPVFRDFWYNLAQSLWAQATAIEEKLAAMPAAEQAAAKQNLIKIYEETVKHALKTRELDPNSEVLYVIEAQSERRMGEYRGGPVNTKAGQDKALAILTAHAATPLDVSEVIVSGAEGGATISGKMKVRKDKLAAGTPVTLHFTLLGLDGKVLAEQDVLVTAGAAEAETPFEAKVVKVDGEIAGWKYVVKS